MVMPQKACPIAEAVNAELSNLSAGTIIYTSKMLDRLRYGHHIEASNDEIVAAIVRLATIRGLFVKFDKADVAA